MTTDLKNKKPFVEPDCPWDSADKGDPKKQFAEHLDKPKYSHVDHAYAMGRELGLTKALVMLKKAEVELNQELVKTKELLLSIEEQKEEKAS